MSQLQSDDRLQDLLDCLLSGTISDAQHAELQGLLKDNPAAQASYFNYVDLDLDLRRLMTMSPEDDGSFTCASPAQVMKQPVIGLQLRAAAALLAVLAATLLVMVWPGVWQWLQPSSPNADQNQLAQTTGVATSQRGVRLVQASGAQLFGELLPPLGSSLQYQREYALTSGILELRFPAGAEVILEAPSVIEIVADDRLIVRVGTCSVHAPPGAEGFQVETPADGDHGLGDTIFGDGE